jgi:hypothetical protein
MRSIRISQLRIPSAQLQRGVVRGKGDFEEASDLRGAAIAVSLARDFPAHIHGNALLPIQVADLAFNSGTRPSVAIRVSVRRNEIQIGKRRYLVENVASDCHAVFIDVGVPARCQGSARLPNLCAERVETRRSKQNGVLVALDERRFASSIIHRTRLRANSRSTLQFH